MSTPLIYNKKIDSKSEMEAHFNNWLAQKNIKFKHIGKPLRICLTGKGSSIDLISILDVLGVEEIINRIKYKLGSKKVRIGIAQNFNGLKTIISNPSLASSFGLLNYALEHDLQIDESLSANKEKKSFFSYIYNFFASI